MQPGAVKLSGSAAYAGGLAVKLTVSVKLTVYAVTERLSASAWGLISILTNDNNNRIVVGSLLSLQLHSC